MPRKRDSGVIERSGRPRFDFWVELPDGQRKRIRQFAKSTNRKDAEKEAEFIKARHVHAAVYGEIKGARPLAEAINAYLVQPV